MSERLARIALGVVSGLALLAALAIDLPKAADGRFWSDGATYYAMAGSLAFDGDLRFEAEDLARVRASYPGGPQGVFLKRVRDGSGEPRLVYAKALVYPAAAAPLVRLLGDGPRPAGPQRARLRRGAVARLRRAAPRVRGRRGPRRARWRCSRAASCRSTFSGRRRRSSTSRS